MQLWVHASKWAVLSRSTSQIEFSQLLNIHAGLDETTTTALSSRTFQELLKQPAIATVN